MRISPTVLTVAAMIAFSVPAAAQDMMTPGGKEPPVNDPGIKPHAPTLPVITDDGKLLEQFGGVPGLTKIMDDVMERWLKNPHTRPFFEHENREQIKKRLVEQFCVIMHGPCEYSGRTMAEAHQGRNIPEASFYALAEELQVTMNKMHVPFAAQNRLIAAIAPMHRDIINR